MKRKIVVLTVFFLLSCEESRNGQPDKTSETGMADTITEYALPDEQLFTALKLPLKIDTCFVMNADTNSRISFSEVKMLLRGISFTKRTEDLLYYMNEFCTIDSLKKNGAYKTYLEKLDIGMTKNSIAFRVGKLNFSDSLMLFLWGIEYSSYEACPFSSGKMIIATLSKKDGKCFHFVLGKRASSADPPALLEEEINSLIYEDGVIEIQQIMTSDDLDVPGTEKTINKIRMQADKNGFLLKEMKTDTLSKEIRSESNP